MQHQIHLNAFQQYPIFPSCLEPDLKNEQRKIERTVSRTARARSPGLEGQILFADSWPAQMTVTGLFTGTLSN
jgi:hypothetical protein